MQNVLSIDVEEHFQVQSFEGIIRRSQWATYPSRVVENTERILRLMRKHDVRATFFMLGWVADHHPELVRAIAADGHELASHGYWHRLVYDQTPEAFSDDIAMSIDAICRAAPGARVIGYRAPSFSITRKSFWAHDILLRHGILYDSSVFPLTLHDRYGVRDAHRFAHCLPSGLWEFPMSTVRWARRNWPVAGGGYFRLYPLWLTRRGIESLNEEGQPAVMYLHPWEFDPEQPRIEEASALSRFRHYVNIHQVEDRLERLLESFSFGPIREVFAQQLKATEVSKIDEQTGLKKEKTCV